MVLFSRFPLLLISSDPPAGAEYKGLRFSFGYYESEIRDRESVRVGFGDARWRYAEILHARSRCSPTCVISLMRWLLEVLFTLQACQLILLSDFCYLCSAYSNFSQMGLSCRVRARKHARTRCCPVNLFIPTDVIFCIR